MRDHKTCRKISLNWIIRNSPRACLNWTILGAAEDIASPLLAATAVRHPTMMIRSFSISRAASLDILTHYQFHIPYQFHFHQQQNNLPNNKTTHARFCTIFFKGPIWQYFACAYAIFKDGIHPWPTSKSKFVLTNHLLHVLLLICLITDPWKHRTTAVLTNRSVRCMKESIGLPMHLSGCQLLV